MADFRYLNSEKFSDFVDAQEAVFSRIAKQANIKLSD